MAQPAYVKSARPAPLRAPNDVNYRTLNVDVAAQRDDPRMNLRDVLSQIGEHDKHESARKAQNDVHDSTPLAELLLVKLRD